MYAKQKGKLKLAGFFSAKLGGRRVTWLPMVIYCCRNQTFQPIHCTVKSQGFGPYRQQAMRTSIREAVSRRILRQPMHIDIPVRRQQISSISPTNVLVQLTFRPTSEVVTHPCALISAVKYDVHQTDGRLRRPAYNHCRRNIQEDCASIQ